MGAGMRRGARTEGADEKVRSTGAQRNSIERLGGPACPGLCPEAVAVSSRAPLSAAIWPGGSLTLASCAMGKCSEVTIDLPSAIGQAKFCTRASRF